MNSKFRKLINRPEFWDIFGVFVWIFLIYLGINVLLGIHIPLLGHFILVIGLIGLVVDGLIVIKKFILNKQAKS